MARPKNVLRERRAGDGRRDAETERSASTTASRVGHKSLAPDNDEAFWDRVRTQWQFGDWPSLVTISLEEFETHSRKADIALLIGAAHQQAGDLGTAGELLKLAKSWGCNREDLARVLIAGTYNTLGRAAVITDRGQEAVAFFEQSVAVGSPANDQRLLTRARILEQASQLHAISSAVTLKLDYEKDRGVALMPRLARVGSGRAMLPTSETDDSVADVDVPRLHVEVDDKTLSIPFHPSKPDFFHIEGDVLVFQLPEGVPGYVVSNETGEFNHVPLTHGIPLKPGEFYELNGFVAMVGDDRPQIWVFQYGGGRRLHSTAFPVNGGRLKGTIRTDAEATRFALGIRVAGEGRLDLSDVSIKLKASPLAAINETVLAETRTLGRELKDLQTKLEKRQAQRGQNTLAQLEAFTRLQAYMGPDFVIPDMHGWPISPDFGVLLIQLAEANGYDAVIEFGSGVSTAIIARALTKVAQRNDAAPAPFVSFDHLQEYYDQTAAILEQAGLRERVWLKLAPLVTTELADESSYRYYDCQAALVDFRRRLTKAHPKILVVVDGPPGATGPKARYPAVPVLWQNFEGDAYFDVLMDDYIRADEREIVRDWESSLTAAACRATVDKTEYRKLEKQACLLKIRIST